MTPRLTVEQQMFLRSRIMPFLDTEGIDRPLSFVLQEVYLQGMKDAIQLFEEREKQLRRVTALIKK